MRYQKNYTDNPVAGRSMYDTVGREAKAEKIVAVLSDYLGDTHALSVLDVSSSTGIMCRYLSRYFHKVTGIDIDEAAVTFAAAQNDAENLQFHVMDALNTSFPDQRFDVVICNQMYEHVPDAAALLYEIYRILIPGGVCYFGATNRLKVIETHYGRVPFLSYLPKTMAHFYLRLLGRGTYYYENLHTYWTLKRLCAKFEIEDYTRKVVAEPDRFAAADMVAVGSWQQRIALAMLRWAYWLSPGYIWLLKKPVCTGSRTQKPSYQARERT